MEFKVDFSQCVCYEIVIKRIFVFVVVSEKRRRVIDPVNDPDYTLYVRVQDQSGASDTALSGNSIVHVVVQQNLWRNPGPIIITENLEEEYPLKIAEVQYKYSEDTLNTLRLIYCTSVDVLFTPPWVLSLSLPPGPVQRP